MKYTAEEVWAMAKMVGDEFSPHAGSMLTAYAERIKADEGVVNKLVVPVAWMCETVNGYKVFNAEGPSFPCNAGVVSELFTYPPAQAAQVDEAAALAHFTDYFVRNYPGPDTIISKPNWHAPKIFRAAQYAIASATKQAAPSAEPVAQGEAVFTGLHADGTPRYEMPAMSQPRAVPSVPDAIANVDACRLHTFDADWQTIRAHLLSQDAEIERLSQESAQQFIRARDWAELSDKNEDRASLAESRLAAATAEIEQLQAGLAKHVNRVCELQDRLVMEWLPIDSAPQDSGLLVVYTPDTGDGERFDFDYREDGVWVVHAESYEHFMMVGGANAAGPDCVCTGPSEDAPYTHFAVLSPPTDRRTPEQPA